MLSGEQWFWKSRCWIGVQARRWLLLHYWKSTARFVSVDRIPEEEPLPTGMRLSQPKKILNTFLLIIYPTNRLLFLFIILCFPNTECSVSNLDTPMQPLEVLLFGRLSLVISEMEHRSFLTSSLVLQKPNGTG